MKKPRLIIDVGGVLFPEMDRIGQKWGEPFNFSIKEVNSLYDEGKYEIILWTSRYTDEHHQNPYNDYSHGYNETLKLLNDAGFKYHQLWMGKPKYLAWIDNRAITIDSAKDGKKAWDKGLKELEKRFVEFTQKYKEGEETSDTVGSTKEEITKDFVLKGNYASEDM